METNEIRIGNLIQNIKTKKEQIVLAIDGIWINDKIYDDFEPIKLTKEWLLKLGFKEYGEDYFLHAKARLTFIYREDSMNKLDILQDGSVLSMMWGCANKVHKIQNLYFAITGKELIK